MPLPFHKQKGFSLIELIVSLAIFVLIISILGTFQQNILQYNASSSGSLNTTFDAREILRVMTKEIRSAEVGNDGSYPVVAAATSTITFFSDIDADGKREEVRYFLTGTSLKKGVIHATGTPPVYNSGSEVLSTLAQNVKNGTSTPFFEYFDNTYDGTSAALAQPVAVSAVRLVKINMTLDFDANRSPLPKTYTSQVMMRNLKDNL